MNEQDSFEDFVERFDSLQNEAQKYGIEGIVTIYTSDPISRATDRWVGYTCGIITGVGLCRILEAKFLAESIDSTEWQPKDHDDK